MSVDIDWENVTTGPEGRELADSIRDFVHQRFQQIELPRFIQSVQVHSFDFGEECPIVELKAICDPLPDFYDYEEEDSGSEEAENIDIDANAANIEGISLHEGSRLGAQHEHASHSFFSTAPSPLHPPPPIDTRLSNVRQNFTLADQIASPVLSRSSTPGIPGGTSNMSYFHLPLSGGLAGTPSGLNNQQVPHPWQNTHAQKWPLGSRQHSPHRMASNRTLGGHSYADPSTRPSTANTYGVPDHHAHVIAHDEDYSSQPSPPPKEHESSPEDIQVVLHMSYTGSVHISLTVQILLDLPMPSFIGIPMNLKIVGLSFDGVALIAYLKKRAHFCFLAQEDAVAMLGDEYAEQSSLHGNTDGLLFHESKEDITYEAGGLFKDIRVESEIGQKEGGKQVLKNVGKVEKFVLEQVRKIFEDEVVYPSYWTFLV